MAFGMNENCGFSLLAGLMTRSDALHCAAGGDIMSECKNTFRNRNTFRTMLYRTVGVLLLAATAAACDKCGDFVSPVGLYGDAQPEACRDGAPKLR
jgi:hypothetical protein